MSVIILILKCLLVLLISLLVVFCLILFIPFNYRFSGNINNDIALDGNIKWLWGLFKISAKFQNKNLKFILTIFKINFNFSNFINKKKLSKTTSVSNKHKSAKKKKTFSINNFINLIHSNYTKFKEIFSIVKPDSFNIHGYFGFDDPALTGQLTAVLASLIHSKNVNLVPIFDDEIIDIKAELSGTIKGYLICYILLKYFFKFKFTFLSIKVKLFNNKKCIN